MYYDCNLCDEDRLNRFGRAIYSVKCGQNWLVTGCKLKSRQRVHFNSFSSNLIIENGTKIF